MREEIWKDIEGFPGYQVSSLGNVRSYKNNRHGLTDIPKLLKPKHGKDGYLRISLWKGDGQYFDTTVHRLVAETYIPKPGNKTDVNHIDGNKQNNQVGNLEWVTRSENMKHAFKNGLCSNMRGVKIIETGETFDSISECARAIDGDVRDIHNCLSDRRPHNLTYKGLHFEYITEPIAEKEKTTFLFDYQMEAVQQLRNGSILCGKVGSGKSRTGLFYYFKEQGGWIDESGYVRMKNPKDLIIITTAKKRNSLEWIDELHHFLITPYDEHKIYDHDVIVDSWNNLPKYKDVKNKFILFDEQRLVSNGAWVKAFLKIAKNNDWILLTATPADTYQDYVPVFLANGFFKNRTEFNSEHVIYSRFTKYPKIERYINTRRLDRLRDRILVQMNYEHKITKHNEDVYCSYDIHKYKQVTKTRWDPYKDKPIEQASGLCYTLRRVVNSDESRQVKLLEILEDHPRVIIFYNFTYELEILRGMYFGDGVQIAEYNGEKHQPLPTGEKWVYLCQYTSACEGWNAITTNAIVFFSQNYSYKVMTQAAGRIDRLNTPYDELYYYYFKSRSGIDLAISKALKEKKKFNENRWIGRTFK